MIATVSSEAKATAARAAGAQHAVNYKTENVVERVRALTGGRGVDRIVEVDFGGNLAVSREVLRPNGTIAAYASMGAPEPVLPYYPLMLQNVNVRLVLVYEIPPGAMAQARSDIIAWLESGKAAPLIAARLPLGRLASAHEMVEGGRQIGNVVVEIDGG